MVPRILKWFLDARKICAPLSLVCINVPTQRLIYELEISSYVKMLPYVMLSLQAYLLTDFKERENKATFCLAIVIHDIPTPHSY
jgi:hypothetical protein